MINKACDSLSEAMSEIKNSTESLKVIREYLTETLGHEPAMSDSELIFLLELSCNDAISRTKKMIHLDY